MSYKTGRGNVAKKRLRFHASVKMVSDYQGVTKSAVAASRRDIRQACSMVILVQSSRIRVPPRADYCFRGYLPSIPDRRSGGNELIRAALEVVRRYFLTRSAAAIHLLSMDKLL